MIFDYSDCDFIMPMDDDMGMNSDGNLHMRIGDNYSMDMESGDIHFTSPWEKSDDTSDFGDNLNYDDSDDEDDGDIFGLGKLFARLW